MITAIEIENFRGFGKKSRLEFRPITLLYGRNSSGKSSVFQLLQYLQRIFCHRDSDTSKLGIGNYASVVHGQDPSKSINIRIECTWNSNSLYPEEHCDEYGRRIALNGHPIAPQFNENSHPDNLAEYVLRDRTDEFEFFHGLALAVDLTVSQGEDGKAIVSRYGLNLGSEHFMTVERNEQHGIYIESSLNKNHSLFNCDYYPSESPKFGMNNPKHNSNMLQHWCGEGCLSFRGSVLPSTERPYEIALEFNWSENNARVAPRINFWVNYLMYGSVIQIEEYLRNISHLGPLRQVPQLGGYSNQSSLNQSWYDGSRAWEALKEMHDEEFSKATGWLSEESKLNLGYKLHRQKLVLKPVETDSLPDSLTESGNSIAGSRMTDVWLSTDTAARLTPVQVGVGISQVLPIIAAVFFKDSRYVSYDGEQSWLLIEQPELHLHPEVQAALADLFITSIESQDVFCESHRMILLETHSELLLLRLLRRLKETANKVGNCPFPLEISKISVQHYSLVEGQTKIQHIAITGDGSLADEWPDDLLSLSFKEVFGK